MNQNLHRAFDEQKFLEEVEIEFESAHNVKKLPKYIKLDIYNEFVEIFIEYVNRVHYQNERGNINVKRLVPILKTLGINRKKFEKLYSAYLIFRRNASNLIEPVLDNLGLDLNNMEEITLHNLCASMDDYFKKCFYREDLPEKPDGNAFMAFVRDEYGWGDYKWTGIRKDLKKQADLNLEKLAVIIYLYDSALEIFSELFEERYKLLEPIENYEFPDESQLPLDEDQSSISQKTEIRMEQSVNTDNIQVSPDLIEPKIAISNTFDDETVDAQLNVSSDTEITSSTRVDMSDISKSPVDSSTESEVLVPCKISQEEYEIPAQSESSLVEFEVVPSEILKQSEISQAEFEVVPPKIQKQSELSNDDYEIQLQREISHDGLRNTKPA